MIPYKPTAFRELVGTFNGQVTAVDVTPNNWGNPDDRNYVENLLEVTFRLDNVPDANPGEEVTHTQKFIKPLTGYGLFQQLLDLTGELPDKDGGSFDEQSLVGKNVTVVMSKNAKGYNNVDAVSADTPVVKPKAAPAKKEDVVEDLPDFLK